jgi:magnesium transporter
MVLKKSLPPETIFNTSDKKNPTEIVKIYYNEKEVSYNKPIDNSNLWVRINGLSNTQAIIEELKKVNLDYLIVEDIFNVTQRSKIEEVDNGLFAIIKTASYFDQDFSHEYLSVLNNIEERLNSNLGKVRNHDSRYLFYAIIDTLIDTNIIFEHEASSLILGWEEKIVSERVQKIEYLHQIRKEILLMKTNISSIVNSIDLIDDILKNPHVIDYKKYYQDLIDHLYRLNDKLNLDWENIKTLYEMHMNNINEKTNSIMKILTIFSATFIPLSFMAGVFGMNFVYMEIFNNPNGMWIFAGICGFIFFMMLGFFKYKKWF